MAGELQRATVEQLTANRKTLTALQWVMVAVTIVYLAVLVYWMVTDNWSGSKLLSIVPLFGITVAALPIRLQLSAIAKELQSRTDS